MSKIISLLVFVALFVVSTAEAQAPYIERNPIPTDVKGMIAYFADEYGANSKELDALFRCESTYRQSAIGEEGEIGVGQFKPGTFDRLAKLMGEKLDIHSSHDQIKLVSFISVYHPNEMPAWTTWRALQNGGTYTFTSRQTGKTYTVVCEL